MLPEILFVLPQDSLNFVDVDFAFSLWVSLLDLLHDFADGFANVSTTRGATRSLLLLDQGLRQRVASPVGLVEIGIFTLAVRALAAFARCLLVRPRCGLCPQERRAVFFNYPGRGLNLQRPNDVGLLETVRLVDTE